MAGVLLLGIVLIGCAVEAPPSLSPALPTPASSESPTAAAGPSVATAPSPTASPRSSEALQEAIDATSLRDHLVALQRIAREHGGTRATGTPGFDTSVSYVADRLAASGYAVERHEFSIGTTTSVNLLAERAGATSEAIVLGAHLDSVAVGPGINDNASGVAALLATAEGLVDLPTPHRSVRFAFWGAEEGGPFGSRAYLEDLASDDLARILMYLNFDMLASPNAIRLVYDEAAAAPGSERITQLFAAHFEDAGLAWEPIDLEGDSDHGPFSAAGIPTGGLFSGGIEPVTESQAATFGARAGEPADPCSHRACDTIDNVDLATLEEMTRAIATVLVAVAAR